jgi:hypothetical protein
MRCANFSIGPECYSHGAAHGDTSRRLLRAFHKVRALPDLRL